MPKQRIQNILELSQNDLQRLYTGDIVYGLYVCEREIHHQAHGFSTERIVVKKRGAFFKFLAIAYLDEVTFTKPFQVFKTEEHVTRTHYSNWVDAPEDDE